MILFLAPYPGPDDTDGYLQRVFAIDEYFSSEQRAYLQFTDHPESGNTTEPPSSDGKKSVYILDPTNPKHRGYIHDLFNQANLIYVHSIFRAEPLLEFFQSDLIRSKTVLDLHGIVPEECHLEGRFEEAQKLQAVEEIMVGSSAALVVVTEQMRRHFELKYPNLPLNIILVPITLNSSIRTNRFDSTDNTPASKKYSDPPRVIYAGGIQPWQNIHLMVDLIKRGPPHLDYDLLTPFCDHMDSLLREIRTHRSIQIHHVPRSKIYDSYQKANFGFVLRDKNSVNSVACPTKLIEYLAMGVIPIVLQPEIGDFHSLNYRFILSEDFAKNRIPDSSRYQEMVEKNIRIYEQLMEQAMQGIQKILQLAQLAQPHQPPKPTSQPNLQELIQWETQGIRFSRQINRITELLTASQAELRARKIEIKLLKTSASYRFGLFALYPLRKTKGLIKQLLKNLEQGSST